MNSIFEVINRVSNFSCDFFLLHLISAFATRLFSVLRFESVIHEFDPYFNYRTTRFLTEQGFYNFHNWFDDRAWYPLGRIIGGTIYPGLMVTSAALYRFLWLLNITVDIRNVCVFLAPFFSSLTTLVTYLLTKEIHVRARPFHISILFTDAQCECSPSAEHWCWFGGSRNDFNCSRLHFTLSGRFI